ncbi:hypothetical protein UO65_2459 [Actinokineospora spheciospongiae]|uniref:Uncharacterized protein n=1 Tax=Actinokineospora spheciospongiae TaxID=909613 RepID=W7IMV8_9PSEU|nr:hypothetical protein UO65_2459 [Actinokineospora spheciospongiae]
MDAWLVTDRSNRYGHPAVPDRARRTGAVSRAMGVRSGR